MGSMTWHGRKGDGGQGVCFDHQREKSLKKLKIVGIYYLWE